MKSENQYYSFVNQSNQSANCFAQANNYIEAKEEKSFNQETISNNIHSLTQSSIQIEKDQFLVDSANIRQFGKKNIKKNKTMSESLIFKFQKLNLIGKAK